MLETFTQTIEASVLAVFACLDVEDFLLLYYFFSIASAAQSNSRGPS